MKKILLIPQIEILNANALSSPYTIGFPAMTAWLGATHALERQLREMDYPNLRFKSMAVVCHHINLQTYKGAGDYVHSIIGTGNPLDKTGKRPSFIEEARCHLTVSLIMEYEGLGLSDGDIFAENAEQVLKGKMKLAGGDILKTAQAKLQEIDDEAEHKALMRSLMPGHCLIERRDLMQQAMATGQDAIDALLDYLKVTHRSHVDEQEKITWHSERKEKGWIVPIATGFHGISELGQAKNQRDPETPHRFAESIITLGEFIMPYRVTDLDQMLWHYHTDLNTNLYLCQQNKQVNLSST
ncbi:type I-F CRISPR-associated protein Csy2 [Candidatus Venteria ishoeyi]|uniref:CRISPR-associated protein Csy2 n=1 Tax=Candidatus Venteria ishoeyi TaxID=1899563 RepID=A0A1H6F706_9GAMM|nr:type I-F CRISPR-associated protein Csy2 [Candidatus Venteria ishoeyi]SEH05917.1 CRISPR-associated protein Csy2 [Candidatus Venteria ishoeyi]